MQIRLAIVLLGFLVLIITMAGCSSSNSLTGSKQSQNVTLATVTPNTLGASVSVPNTQLTFFYNGNGTAVGSVNLGATGTNTYGATPGPYTIAATTNALPQEVTYIGTYTWSSVASPLSIITPTAYNQLPGYPAYPNAMPPTDGVSATLVVQAVSNTGALLNQPFTVQTGVLPAVSSTATAPYYAVVTGLAASMGTYVVVTPTGGLPVTVNNLSITANNVVLLNAVL